MEKLGRAIFIFSIILGILAVFIINKGYEKHKNDLYNTNAQKYTQAILAQGETKEVLLKTIPPNSKVEEFTLLASDEGFYPEEIIAKRGDVVVINLTSKGYHNFSIPELGIHSTPLASNEQQKFAFLATESGIFTFISDTNGYYSLHISGKMTIQ